MFKYADLIVDNGRYFNVRYLEYFPYINHSNPLPTSYLFYSSFEHLNLSYKNEQDLYKILNNKLSVPVCVSVNRVEKMAMPSDYFVEYYFFTHKDGKELNQVIPLLNSFRDDNHKIEEIKIDDEITNELNINKNIYLVSIKPNGSQIEEFSFFTFTNIRKNTFINILGFEVNTEKFIENAYTFDIPNGIINPSNIYHVFLDQNTVYQLLYKIIELAKTLFPNENPELALSFLDFPYLKGLYLDDIGKHLPNGIAQKKGSIGLYFAGITFEKFLGFLEFHDYPSEYILNLRKNEDRLKHLLTDFKIDFYLESNTFKIRKTAFFVQL